LDLKETTAPAITTLLTSLQHHLTPLRGSNLLTTYSPSTQTLLRRSLTIILSGSATLSHITNTSLNPFADLFLDALLDALSPPTGSNSLIPYNISNTALASTSLPRTVGMPGLREGKFSVA
jgi:hypothetical protein